LEWIIGWEKGKKLPKKPHITAPARRKDALLGKSTKEAKDLDGTCTYSYSVYLNTEI